MARNKSALSKLNQNNLQPSAEITNDSRAQSKNKNKARERKTSSPLDKVGRVIEIEQTIENKAETGADGELVLTVNEPPKEPNAKSALKPLSFPFSFRKTKENDESVNQTDDTAAPEPQLPNIEAEHKAARIESVDYDALERDLEENEAMAERQERKIQRNRELGTKIATIMLSAGCIYLIFLIYGALNTQYVYNEQGKVIPQIMSIQQIKALDEFEDIANEYRQARTLYETILRLDYRLAAGIEDPLLLAPEYENALVQLNELLLQCRALVVPAKYSPIHDMLETWLDKKVAIYCQDMSKAISQNDSASASRAVQYKQDIYNYFSNITANLKVMGATVDGADITDIINWSPESYIRNEIGGELS